MYAPLPPSPPTLHPQATKPTSHTPPPPTAYTFHAYGRTEGVAGIIISDQDYPALVAHQLLSKIVDEFLARYPRTAFAAAAPPALPFPPLKEYIVKYQDPQQADSIMKIQKELDETKIVLHKTIESVLERGEKIDSLVAKSDGLSAQSKMFYTQVCGSRRWGLLGREREVGVLMWWITVGEEAEFVLRADVRFRCDLAFSGLRAVSVGLGLDCRFVGVEILYADINPQASRTSLFVRSLSRDWRYK